MLNLMMLLLRALSIELLYSFLPDVVDTGFGDV